MRVICSCVKSGAVSGARCKEENSGAFAIERCEALCGLYAAILSLLQFLVQGMKFNALHRNCKV